MFQELEIRHTEDNASWWWIVHKEHFRCEEEHLRLSRASSSYEESKLSVERREWNTSTERTRDEERQGRECHLLEEPSLRDTQNPADPVLEIYICSVRTVAISYLDLNSN